jgi:hypothetical protein
VARLSRQLFDDEQVKHSARLHAVRLLRPTLALLLAAAVAGFAYGYFENAGPAAGYVAAGGAALVGLAAVRFGWAALAWHRTRFFVTSHRFIGTSGVLRSRIWAVPLRTLAEARCQRSLLGRMLGYGEVVVRTPGNSYRLSPVANPRALERALNAPPPASQEASRPAARPDVEPMNSTRVYTAMPSPEARVLPSLRPEPSTAQDRHRSDSPVGRSFGGRYFIQRRIATGGMGTVYEAVDERLGRSVAVKVLKDELLEDPSFVERFRREARSSAALSHPNIASIHDYGEESDAHYIVMERLDGRDLARVLEETGRLEEHRAAEITCRVLDGLQHAHERGVVHRDIKPANVVVAEDGRVKVTDFGIAQALGSVRLTATGAFLGSAHYVAPERVRGEPAVPGSDIYSVGVLLYEMVVGRPPFDGESLMSVLESHLTKDVPPPSRAAPGLSPVLDLVVAGATARRLEQRFSSAVEMMRHLSSALVAPGRPARGETHGLRLDGETRLDEDTPPVPYVF